MRLGTRQQLIDAATKQAINNVSDPKPANPNNVNVPTIPRGNRPWFNHMPKGIRFKDFFTIRNKKEY